MREEIFGPVLVATTFRTPDEAVALANNTRYGLAASVWTENVNRALEVAARIKAGVVWINSTNLFDAAAGFGGYRESGFGREGGREGLYEYRVAEEPKGKTYTKSAALNALPGVMPSDEAGPLDRTAKLYVGGKQARPDSGYSYAVLDPKGREVGLAGLGNRKDIRNAVEAAAKASGWGAATAHNRAQVLYYVAENLSARAEEFANRLRAMTGASARAAEAEVEASIRRAFFYAGFADKFDGAVHATRTRFVTIAMNEPWGVMGVVCPDEAPLLAFVSLVLPAIAMGNCVVAVPSAPHALIATDLYSVLDTSDVPGGVVNIVTGEANALSVTLAEHEGVDALWYVGDAAGAAKVEALSAGNLKATWTASHGDRLDTRRRPPVPAPRNASEERLDALRRIIGKGGNVYLDRFKLDGRVAVVTGGAQAIGLACVEALSEAGAHVYIADRNPTAAADAQKAMQAKGYKTDFVEMDVTDSAAVDAVAAQVLKEKGRVDILVCNAGIARSETPAEDLTDEHWLNVLDVNLNGLFWCCRSFGRLMLAAGRGSIVNIGSMSGYIVNKPQPQAQYNASKAGVHHLTKSLAAEWAARGVRVNSVAPTYINTPMTAYAKQNKAMFDTWMDYTPMGRMGEVDEIAAVVLFLASDAASLLTGSIVVADGGYTCW